MLEIHVPSMELHFVYLKDALTVCLSTILALHCEDSVRDELSQMLQIPFMSVPALREKLNSQIAALLASRWEQTPALIMKQVKLGPNLYKFHIALDIVQHSKPKSWFDVMSRGIGLGSPDVCCTERYVLTFVVNEESLMISEDVNDEPRKQKNNLGATRVQNAPFISQTSFMYPMRPGGQSGEEEGEEEEEGDEEGEGTRSEVNKSENGINQAIPRRSMAGDSRASQQLQHKLNSNSAATSVSISASGSASVSAMDEFNQEAHNLLLAGVDLREMESIRIFMQERACVVTCMHNILLAANGPVDSTISSASALDFTTTAVSVQGGATYTQSEDRPLLGLSLSKLLQLVPQGDA